MLDEEILELDEAIGVIHECARKFGLDPFPTHFELVPPAIMYEFGAYGLPGRFSHWTRGKAFHVMKTHYDFGLQKIYELVINNNPSQAYLLDTNTLLANKFVVAHVLGHTDFFKNNVYFQLTREDMSHQAERNADWVRRYEFEHGRKEVETFLDACLSIEEHVDFLSAEREALRKARMGHVRKSPNRAMQNLSPVQAIDDLFSRDERSDESEGSEKKRRATERRSSDRSPTDLLLFLLEEGTHLEAWQHHLLEIVWQERLYFTPQVMTKIMNEGWASFWHARIMRELDLDDADYLAYAQLNASVLTPPVGSINPYLLGLKIWESIEKKTGSMERLFEVRATEDDISFLRNYLDEDLVEELDLYIYKRDGTRWIVSEKEWEQVREALVLSRVNGGSPVIEVVDYSGPGRGDLYLRHRFDGRELDLDYAKKTLEHMYTLWQRPVHLETIVDGKPRTFSCHGSGQKDR